MGDIFNQLGELFLGAVPTMLLFLLVVAAYGLLVRRPLDRVLAERRARTSGAVEQARGAMSAAEAETAVFEDKLRAAKKTIHDARDACRQGWDAERERVLGEARAVTAARVAEAARGIEQSRTEALAQLEAMSGELSQRILRAVLPAGAAEAAQ